ncbi:MAG TPA: hypothetical protein PK720_04205 [bacterium]|nr:hypothetical protein [bacterium]
MQRIREKLKQSKGWRIAMKYNINPAFFAILYIITIPPAFLAGAWVAQGMRVGLDSTPLFWRVAVTALFTFAPSLYILFCAKNVPSKLYTLFFILVGSGLAWRFGTVYGLKCLALITLLLIIYRTIRFWERTKVVVRSFDPELYLDQITTWFQEAYSSPPWMERFICASCTKADDFDPVVKYDHPGRCPKHDTELTPFWKKERVLGYLREAQAHPNFYALGGFSREELKGMAWVYEQEVGGKISHHLDVIVVDPSFRDKSRWRKAVLHILLALTLRLKSQRLLNLLARLPTHPFLHIFVEYLLLAKKIGYAWVSTRTSINSKYLSSQLRLLGYHEAGNAPTDSTRVFFIAALP